MASTISLQALQPRVKEIQERYKGRPQEEMQVEVARLYKEVRGDLGSFFSFHVFFTFFFLFCRKTREKKKKKAHSQLSLHSLSQNQSRPASTRSPGASRRS